jgi:hypothetical protein
MALDNNYSALFRPVDGAHKLLRKPRTQLIRQVVAPTLRSIQVRPKKRRKPYLRCLWLDLNETKAGVSHFQGTIGTTKSGSGSDDG